MRYAVVSALVVAALSIGGRAGADPRVDYMLQCRGCHGPDGQGTAGAAPSLRHLDALLQTPAGRAYLIGVPGVSRSELDDAATAALLNWIVSSLAEPGAAAGVVPFSAAEVTAHRRPPLLDPAAVRAAALRAQP